MTNLEFEKLILVQKERLYKFALSILSDSEEAKDAVQEVVLKLWQEKNSLDKKRNVSSFCMKSIKNYCVDLIRKRKLHLKYKNDTQHDNSENQNLDNKDLVSKIKDELKNLSAQQRIAIELKDFLGFNYEEVSEIMEIPVNAVRVNVSRGRQKLYEIFKEELIND